MHKNDFLSREVFTFLFLILVLSCFVVILFLFCLIFLLCFCFVTSFHKTRIKHYCQTKNCSGYFKYFIVVNKQNGIKNMCECVWVLMLHKCSICQQSSLRSCFIKKVILKISQHLQENTCAGVSFLIKLQPEACNFIKKETLPRVFPCECCEIFKNAIFIAHIWWSSWNFMKCWKSSCKYHYT